jgi:superfamily II DNA or RNA helicase
VKIVLLGRCQRPYDVSDSSIQRQRALQAAQRLLETGRVLEVRVLQGGQIVTGVVSADGEPPPHAGRHRVYIRRGAGGGEECSCGTAACVHIVAVSLAAQAGHAPVGAARSTPAGEIAPARTAERGPQAQRLHYVLESPARRDGLWQLSVWVVQAADSALPPQRFAPRAGPASGEYPRYVDGEDRAILRGLIAAAAAGAWALAGAAGGEALRLILATGRAHAGTVNAPALHVGEPQRARLAWRVDEAGLQQLVCEPAALGLILDTEPAFWLDPAGCEGGVLELPCAAQLLRAWWPRRLAPEEVEALGDELAQTPGLPLPAPLRVRREPAAPFSGSLRLAAGPQALVAVCCNGRPVALSRLEAAGAHVRLLIPGGAVGPDEVIEVPRDLAQETRLRGEIGPWLPPTPGSDRDWLRLLIDGVPALREAGWQVEIDTDFPYRVVWPGQWYADARTQQRSGWFDLRLGALVDGEPVNLMPALTRYLEAAQGTPEGQDALLWESTADAACGRIGAHWLLLLEDGRYLAVPLARMQRIADTLVELLERNNLREDALTLPRAQSARLAQLAGELEGLEHLGDDASLWMSQEALAELTAPAPLAAPAGFPAQLRPYQETGLGWLQALARHGQGGLLADDMGLGKTLQALAHIASEKAAGRLGKPVLIAAPVSALVTWQREIRRFMPQLDWVLWHGSHRRQLRRALVRAELILTGYPLLTLDSDILQGREYSLVILDEAQTIKNPHARVSVAARGLCAARRLCLTGTPMENHLGELWSLFEFLQPGILGTESAFQRYYRTPIEKNGSRSRALALNRRIAPYLLRRTKENVATELPPKTEIIQSIELDERQRDFYDSIRLAMHQRVREIIQQQGIIRSQITILDALMKLRQACCDPRLVNLPGGEPAPAADGPVPSAKLEWLAQALPQLVAEGRRILLFSQFTSMLALIEAQLAALELPYCLLTGQTRARGVVVERFQSGAVPLFLISLKAGGTALNLTAADTVIHYDPWWNPAAESQATDRAHRIGQDKPVFVYKLIAAGTLEERILDLQARKQALAATVYGASAAAGGGLTEADVEALLA